MRTPFILLCLIRSLFPVDLFAGDFLNLDFESPDLTHLVSERTLTSEALRGWNFTTDRGEVNLHFTHVGSQGEPLSLAAVVGVPHGLDFGKYGLYFGQFEPPDKKTYFLSQTGVIPVNSTSLRIYYGDAVLGTQLSPSILRLSIQGEPVNLQHVPGYLNYILDADVSPWAGKDVNLEFVFAHNTHHLFDIAGFISTPEPSAYALLGGGAAVLAWFGRKPKPRC